MNYVKKDDLLLMQKVLQMLETRKDSIRPEEVETFQKFRSLVEGMEADREALLEKTRQNMAKMRATPEGRERSKATQRKANHKRYEKIKAQRKTDKA